MEAGRAAGAVAAAVADGADRGTAYDVDLPGGESWRESAAYAPGERTVDSATVARTSRTMSRASTPGSHSTTCQS